MAKMTGGALTRKISLAQIKAENNVRRIYNDIDELAASIRAYGLIAPVVVKSLGTNADGIEEYELVAGFRRFKAFQTLFDAGEPFSMIEAIIMTGETRVLQLVENLQRSDLSPAETEEGVASLVSGSGGGRALANKEAAAMLSKSEEFISRNIGAYRIRTKLTAFGCDTSKISTSALYEMVSLSGESLHEVASRINGGKVTASEARQLVLGLKTQEAARSGAAEASDDAGGDGEEDGYVPRHKLDEETKELMEEWMDDLAEASAGRYSAPRKKASSMETGADEFAPPAHKTVDLNDVFLIIKDYIDEAKREGPSRMGQVRAEAGLDILELLHEKL